VSTNAVCGSAGTRRAPNVGARARHRVELQFLDAPGEGVTPVSRSATRSSEGATSPDPAVRRLWNDRIERPDADELALFDRPTERRLALDGRPGVDVARSATTRQGRLLSAASSSRRSGAVVMTVCGSSDAPSSSRVPMQKGCPGWIEHDDQTVRAVWLKRGTRVRTAEGELPSRRESTKKSRCIWEGVAESAQLVGCSRRTCLKPDRSGISRVSSLCSGNREPRRAPCT